MSQLEESDQVLSLKNIHIVRQEQIVAVTTPIQASDGTVSKKTPIVHLPVYKVTMNFTGERTECFYCDLADLTDLIDKLKAYQNQWRRYGPIIKE